MCADQKKKKGRKKQQTRGLGEGAREEKKTSQCHELFKGGGLHSRGQCSLTFVTGSERERHSRWNKQSWLFRSGPKSCRTGAQPSAASRAVGNVYFCRYQMCNKYIDSIQCPFSWCPSWAIFFFCGLPAWEADLWPPQPDAGNESFSFPSQQHVPSYYKIHVEAGTAFLIFHTRGDKVNMRGSEDGYQARRVIANWVMFGYTLRAL